MELKFHASESTVKPELLDITSCPDGVYIRRNVTTAQREMEDGALLEMYLYEEAFLSKENYAVYLAQENAANIDYIAMMQEVDL